MRRNSNRCGRATRKLQIFLATAAVTVAAGATAVAAAVAAATVAGSAAGQAAAAAAAMAAMTAGAVGLTGMLAEGLEELVAGMAEVQMAGEGRRRLPTPPTLP